MRAPRDETPPDADPPKAGRANEDEGRSRCAARGGEAPSPGGSRPAELHELMGFLLPAFQRMEPVADDAALADRTKAHVTGNDRLTPAEQVDLYRRQFWLRHRDSLLEDYPGLHHVIGEEVFDDLARAYLEAHPPRTPSLRDLGADLIPFAERWGGFPADRREIALDMLRYEHAFIDLFDGPEPEALDAARIASLPEDAWERARIVLSPLLARVRVAYPVHHLRAAVREGEAAPLPDRSPACVAVFRQNLSMRFDELEPAAFDLLEALAAGVPLVAACERVAASLDPAEADALGARVGAWFQAWTARKWIVSVEV